ncbi:LacI family transcriptional regulator [Trebonia kvetii]|uniref:LacI family transcriptional regulator n=1 Tax=Trebonia kvetii TaxID=2480626 RepID=A0A6P2BYD2_9ACTN|nr:LacI family DNA-binding transcriptional regulator [Trebonia kvetii]TVZ02203.1 LacI family transcriptional regulator [Trebonia kvetii]
MTATERPRITAADIARAAGVSRATVGFVLNNTPGQTISEATRERVLQEAARRGYRPNSAAQALASGRSRIVLFVLPDWPADYAMHLYLGEAAHVLGMAGYSLITYTRYPSDQARPLWETLDPEVVVGMFPFSDEEMAALRASGIAKVYPGPGQPPPDEQPLVTAGTRMQVQYLAGLGHRKLAFASPSDPRLTVIAGPRLRAAQRTASSLGIACLDARELDSRDESARKAALAWHAAGVTGVIAYNDETAAVFAGGALRAGLSVPGDLAVVGHDDSPISAAFVPGLSSVRVDYAGMGRYVAWQAVHLADGRPLPGMSPGVTATVVARESA